MAKQGPSTSSSHPVLEDDAAAEQESHLRMRSTDDRFVDELHALWANKQITQEQLVERIKDYSIAKAKKDLSDSEFREFERFMRDNLEMPNLDKLRR